MPDPIESLAFDRVWTNKADFPTYEGSEDKVRADMQYLYNVIQNFINVVIVPALNDIISGSYTPGAVDTAAIQDGAVTLAKLASASVNSSKIVNGSIQADDIGSQQITQDKLAQPSVGTAQIVDLAVTEGKIASNAVTSGKIKNSNVTAAKLGADILPKKVGFVIGTGNPVSNPALLSNEQIYVKLES